VLVCYRARDTSTNGAVTRIGTKRGEASHVRRSDRLLKPQLRCALHFGYCAARLHSFCFFCFMVTRRFANCAICSLVAEFALMVYGLRINVPRCRWLITPIIRGKISSLISRLCAGATGIAEILFEQPVRLLRDYRRFHYHGSRNYVLRLCAGATEVAEIRFEQPVRLLREYRGLPHRGSRNYFLRLCAGATGVAEIRFEQPVRLLREYRGLPHRGSRNYFLRLCAGATGVAEIRFEQPVRLLREYRWFPHRGSRNYFLCITASFKSACLAIDKTQQALK